MANYYGHFRSNYFRVKDPVAFKAWCEGLHMQVITAEDGKEHDEAHFFLGAALPPQAVLIGDPLPIVRYGFMQGEYDDSGMIPSDRLDEETDDYEELDFPAELAKHLLDGEVAIVQECGAEKLRYIVGSAFAVNATGEVVSINLREGQGARHKHHHGHLLAFARSASSP
jgi:hypothetical protein